MIVYKQESNNKFTELRSYDLGMIVSGSIGLYGEYEDDKLKPDIYYFEDTNFPDGIYKLLFCAYDQNNNTKWDSDGDKQNVYYIYLDSTSPSCGNINATATSNSIELNWTEPTDDDYYGTIIAYKEKNSENDYEKLEVIQKGTEKGSIPELKVDKEYDIQISAYDKYGNYSTTSLTQYTKPSPVTNLKVERDSTNPGTSLSVSWSNPADGEFTGIKLYYKKGNDKDYTQRKIEDTSTTSYTITGLIQGCEYDVKVETYGTVESNTNEVSKKCTTKPLPITGLSVTNVTNTSVALKWTNPASGSITAHHIYKMDLTNNDTKYTSYGTTSSSTSTTYTVNSLTPSHKYTFKVVPYSGEESNEAEDVIVTQITKPNPISGLSVTSTTTTSASLKWTNPTSSSITAHRIYKMDLTNKETKYTLYGTTASTSTTYTVSSLTPGHNYTFKVVPYYEHDGTSDEAPEVTVTQTIRPNMPTYSVSSGTTSITINFTKPTTGACDGYKLYWGTSANNLTLKQTITTSSCTVTGLTAGTTYYYRIYSYAGTWSSNTALNTNTSSSNDVVLTKPGVSTNLVLSKNDSNPKASMNLSWTKPSSGNVTGYEISYGETDSANTKTVNVTTTSTTVTNLAPGHKYYYKIRAYYTSEGKTEYSDYTGVVSRYTAPDGVTNLNVAIKGTFNLKLEVTWKNPSTSYAGIIVKYKISSNSNWIDVKLSKNDSKYTIDGYLATWQVMVITYSDDSNEDDPCTVSEIKD